MEFASFLIVFIKNLIYKCPIFVKLQIHNLFWVLNYFMYAYKDLNGSKCKNRQFCHVRKMMNLLCPNYLFYVNLTCVWLMNLFITIAYSFYKFLEIIIVYGYSTNLEIKINWFMIIYLWFIYHLNLKVRCSWIII